jgi:SAM-dependent methyltransferase
MPKAIQERRQQNFRAWTQEHLAPTLLRMASTEASGSVVRLLEFAAANGIVLGPDALDIGCGKGRNSIALAQQGLRVKAFDRVEAALTVLKERARRTGVDIEARVGSMDETWPYADDTFDLVLDDTASMSIGNEAGIECCRSEMYRVLRPSGYAIVYTLAIDDPFLLQYPRGEEANTVMTPDGKIERLYSSEEILDLYNMFASIHQERWSTYDMIGNTEWERRRIWTLFQKPRKAPSV